MHQSDAPYLSCSFSFKCLCCMLYHTRGQVRCLWNTLSYAVANCQVLAPHRNPKPFTKVTECLWQHHGLSSISTNDVFRAAVLTKVLYCALAWSGFCSATDCERLDVFVRRCKQLHYSDDDIPAVEEMFINVDAALFSSCRKRQVCAAALPIRSLPKKYSLRPRQHSKQLIPKTMNWT